MFGEHRWINLMCRIKKMHIGILNHLEWSNYDLYINRAVRALQDSYGISNLNLHKKGIGFVITGSQKKIIKEIPNVESIEIFSEFEPPNYISESRRIDDIVFYMSHTISLSPREESDIYATSRTKHIFMDLKTRKQTIPTKEFLELLKSYYPDQFEEATSLAVL